MNFDMTETSPPLIGARSARTETAEEYRRELMRRICKRYPGADAAASAISEAIEGIEDPQEREHASLHEVRYLLTSALVPQGPGTLVDVAASEIYSRPLRILKSWMIQPIPALSFDYETEPLPFGDASADGVLFCEVLEHFVRDPLYCLIEINRILKPGGFIVLTTPNAASWYAVHRALRHEHPSRWPYYSLDPIKGRHDIHAREYLVKEVKILLEAAGFAGIQITTCDYGIAPPFMPIRGYSNADRGETIFSIAYKASRPRKRAVVPPYVTDEPFAAI
jgi:SAM-dependent methyltransferase